MLTQENILIFSLSPLMVKNMWFLIHNKHIMFDLPFPFKYNFLRDRPSYWQATLTLPPSSNFTLTWGGVINFFIDA
jgi:hypothetical protein